MANCKFTYLTVVIFLFLFIGCSGYNIQRSFRSHDEDWITYGGSAGRTNQSKNALLSPLDSLWIYDARAGISAMPLVKDSLVIVSTLHGELQVVHLSKGKSIGKLSFESAIVGTPVIDGVNVYVPVARGEETLVAMDLKDGRKLWGKNLGNIESSLLLVDRYLYVTTLEGLLYCIDKYDGKEVWKYEIPESKIRNSIRTSPATDGEILVIGSDNGSILALERLTGTLVWTYQASSSVLVSPVVIGTKVIIGSFDGSLYCLDIRDGKKLWGHQGGSSIFSSVAATRENVFVGFADGSLRNLSMETGNEKWRFQAKSVINSPPLLSGKTLYVGSLDRHLYALDMDSGKEIWQYLAKGRIKVSPVIWRNYLLLTLEDKYVLAFKGNK